MEWKLLHAISLPRFSAAPAHVLTILMFFLFAFSRSVKVASRVAACAAQSVTVTQMAKNRIEEHFFVPRCTHSTQYFINLQSDLWI